MAARQPRRTPDHGPTELRRTDEVRSRAARSDLAVRQYLLAFPYALAGLAATRPDVLSALSRIFWESLRLRYRRWARAAGHASSPVETGAVTGVHRAGASLNVHVHFHVLCLDGVYVRDGDALRFEAAPAPTRGELEAMVQHIHARVMKWLARRGLLRDADASNAEPERSPTEALTALGMQRGIIVTTRDESVVPEEAGSSAPPRVTEAVVHEGFNLHASGHLAADDDLGRERLARYLSRPAFSLARLRVRRDGNVSYRVKKASRGRVTERVMTPREALARLAAIVPPLRYPLLRFHGVLAPRHRWRARTLHASVSSEGVQGDRAGARRRKEHGRRAARGIPVASRRRTRGLSSRGRRGRRDLVADDHRQCRTGGAECPLHRALGAHSRGRAVRSNRTHRLANAAQANLRHRTPRMCSMRRSTRDSRCRHGLGLRPRSSSPPEGSPELHPPPPEPSLDVRDPSRPSRAAPRGQHPAPLSSPAGRRRLTPPPNAPLANHSPTIPPTRASPTAAGPTMSRAMTARLVLETGVMKTAKNEQAGANQAGGKGEKVRTAIAEMLSSGQRGKEPVREVSQGKLSSREPAPTSGRTPAEIDAQDRLAEIEQHVGKLVHDPELERDALEHRPKR
jgi:hypothetical protein